MQYIGINKPLNKVLGSKKNEKTDKDKIHPRMIVKKTNVQIIKDSASIKKTEFITTEVDEQDNLFNEPKKMERLDTDNDKAHDDLKTLLMADDDENLNNLEDGRKSKLEFQKLQIIDTSTAIIAFIGAFITIMAYDLEFDQKDNDLLLILLWVVFVSTKVSIVLNVLKYLQELTYLKARNLISKKENLISSGAIWFILLETFVLLLQPYPFLHSIKINVYDSVEGVHYYYYVNDIFAILLMARVFLLCRILLNNSRYRSPRARRLSTMYGADNDYLFACKCLMKASPFLTVLVLFGASIFIFGYMLRICERPLNRNPTVVMDFSTYWNSMWCVILTMTTVGYGDFYAKTHFGRIVSFLCCIWGVFVVSLMVVTLNNVLGMSSAEEKALTVLDRLSLRKHLKAEAAYILTNMAKVGVNNKRKKGEELETENKKAFRNIKKHLNDFKGISRNIRSLDDGSNISEEMTRQFEFMRDEIKDIKQQNQDLKDVVNKLNNLIQLKFSDNPIVKNQVQDSSSKNQSVDNKSENSIN